MELLNEFFDPIPISVIGLILFGFVFLWVLSRAFRFPPNFAKKEELREEIRYRLFSETLLDDEPPAEEETADGGEPAEKDELKPSVSALPPPLPPSSSNVKGAGSREQTDSA